MNGDVFAVYKPRGPSSAAFLNQLKKTLGVKKMGHAGTLDPLASGVLVVGINGGTKRLAEIVGKDKEYLATIKLGEESATDDEEGEKRPGDVRKPPSRQALQAALKKFVGTILQAPPRMSAVKIGGERAWRLARRGKAVEPRPRPVIVRRIDLLGYRWPCVKLRISTGPGVYIRAIARDLGRELGTLGYLAGLERTRVGEFAKQQALTVEELCASGPALAGAGNCDTMV